jgi:NitT/TauT family transport system permease protein
MERQCVIERIARTIKENWIGYIIPISIVVLCTLVSLFSFIPDYKLPSIQTLFYALKDFSVGLVNDTSYSRQLWPNLIASIGRIFRAFILAMILGVTLGFISGRNKIIRKMIDPTLNAIRSIPGVGWLPIAIVWFGVGENNTLFLMTLATFFPIYLNTQSGVQHIPKKIENAGKMLGAKGISLYKDILLPAAFPSILVGLRLGFGISWSYLVLGEITGVNYGIGAVMSDARMLGRVDMIIVCMLIIALLGKVSDVLLVKFAKAIYPNMELSVNKS